MNANRYSFARFKLKSLIMLNRGIGRVEELKRVKNRKLFKSALRWDTYQIVPRDTTYMKGVRFYGIIKINESTLAVGDTDYNIKLWNFIDKKFVLTMKGHSEGVKQIVKLNASHIASASYDSTVKIWNIKDGRCEATLIEHKPHERGSIKITKLNKKQLVICADELQLWDWETQNCVFKRCLLGYRFPRFKTHTLEFVFSVIKTNTTQIAISCIYYEIQIWDFKTNKTCTRIRKPDDIDDPHTGLIKLNNSTIASINGKLICVWDLEKENCVLKIREEHNIRSIIALSENQILSLGVLGLVQIHNLQENTIERSFQLDTREVYFTCMRLNKYQLMLHTRKHCFTIIDIY